MSAPRKLAWLTLLLVTSACSACAGALPRSRHASTAAAPADAYAARGRAFEQAGDLVRAEQYYAMALRAGARVEQVLPRLLQVCLSSSRVSAALRYARLELLRAPQTPQLEQLVAALESALRPIGQTTPNEVSP